MQILDSLDALRVARQSLVGRVGFVPTMGALHEGHLALVREATADNDVVIVTIFINPTQFAPHEDLSKYPRDLPRDLEILRNVGVDVVFTPTSEMMYPPGFQTWVEVTDVSRGLEGARRPGHFRGVSTVVNKLFNLTQPDTAYFGQKDAQQVAVIKRMVRDLNIPVSIVVCPTTREPDGLAMSSRNVYLTDAQRASAPILYQALNTAGEFYTSGERDPNKLRTLVESLIAREEQAELEYVSVVDACTLQEQEVPTASPLLLSLTAKFGDTRLLDNMLLPISLNTREGLTATLGGPS